MKERGFRVLGCLLAIVMVFSPKIALLSHAAEEEAGVVNVSSKVNVRQGPGTGYAILTTPDGAYVQLKNGHQLIVEASLPSEDAKNPEAWYRIRFVYLGESYVGCIYSPYVTVIHQHRYDDDCDGECNTCGESREPLHAFGAWEARGEGHGKTCALCLQVQEASHAYESPCDPECDVCSHLRPVEHRFELWGSSHAGHWSICSECGACLELQEHSFETVCAESCSVCFYERSDAHVYESPCHSQCKECSATRQAPHSLSAWFGEENGHWQYCLLCEEVFGPYPHTYDSPCDPECNDCLAIRFTDHVLGEWLQDKESHWKLCSLCREALEQEGHVYQGEEDGECLLCGYWRWGFLTGDANGDESLSFSDIQRIYQHLSTENKLSGMPWYAADANGDMAVSFGDIQWIYRALAQEQEIRYYWPVPEAYTRLSQGYKGASHTGIDIPTDRTSVEAYAMSAGTVVVAESHWSYGNYVVIDHGIHKGKALRTLYAHLDQILVEVGQEVEGAQVIGMTGTTGNSTGIHLHFMVYEDGVHVDPLTYVKQP